MPWDVKYWPTDPARRSDNVWLYESEPLLSVCPATSTTVWSYSVSTFDTDVSTSKKAGTQVRAIGSKSNIARHIQCDVVADASNTDASALQLST